MGATWTTPVGASWTPERIRAVTDQITKKRKTCKCGCGLFPKRKTSFFVSGHNRSKSSFQFIVNKISGCWEWQASKDGNGYGMLTRGGTRIRAHVVYYKWFYGKSQTMLLDHECLNKSCVNPFHLRDASKGDNQRNVRIYKNNKTGFKGVYPTNSKLYQVTIRVNKKTILIGRFKSKFVAARAYDDAVRRLIQTRPIRINFPVGKSELPAR